MRYEYNELRGITNEESPSNDPECTACRKPTDEPHECYMCKDLFCERDIDLDYQSTGLDLCLNCQEEKERIIVILVSEAQKMEQELDYLRGDSE